MTDQPTWKISRSCCSQLRQRGQQRKVVVLSGLSGIGKTYPAAEFARRHHDKFTSVLWLDGRSKQLLEASLAGYARKIPDTDSEDAQTTGSKEDATNEAADVLRWLSRQGNTAWLLIFDDVDHVQLEGHTHVPGDDDDKYDIRDYLADHGSILITTKRAGLAEVLGELKTLEVVEAQVSREIFQKHRGRELRELFLASKSRNGEADDATGVDETADELFELLDGLPVALARAGSYLKDPAQTISSYVSLYKDRLKDFDTLWSPLLDRVKAESSDAANLLYLWAFLDHGEIWHGLLARTPNPLQQSRLGNMVFDEARFSDAVQVLQSYSLIKPHHRGHGSYVIHRVLHRWIAQTQDKPQASEMLQLAVSIVGLSIPEATERNYGAIQKRLLRHAESCLWWFQELDITGILDSNFGRSALERLGDLYLDQGEPEQAQTLYEWVLDYKKDIYDPEHPTIFFSINRLAFLHAVQGQLATAEKMFQQVLSARKQSCGTDHPDYLETVSDLADVYADQGRGEEAEANYLAALEGFEKHFASDHPSILTTTSSLALLYQDQGRLVEAESMQLKVLLSRTELFGEDHPATLKQATISETSPWTRWIWREPREDISAHYKAFWDVFGPDHPSTITSLCNLALVHTLIGKTEEAETAYRYVRNHWIASLGLNHPSTLQVVDSLGTFYFFDGRLEQAEVMYQRALDGKEMSLGQDHESCLDTVCNLAELFGEEGRLEEAEKMYERAMTGFEKSLGYDHWKSQTIRLRQELIRVQRGKIEEVTARDPSTKTDNKLL